MTWSMGVSFPNVGQALRRRQGNEIHRLHDPEMIQLVDHVVKHNAPAAHHTKPPRKGYADETLYDHFDAFNRQRTLPKGEYRLSPSKGKLKLLSVQASYELFSSENDTAWTRNPCENVAPLNLRVANRPYRILAKSTVTALGYIAVVPAWLFACVYLLIANFATTAAEIRNGGDYDPFPYKVSVMLCELEDDINASKVSWLPQAHSESA